MLEHEFDAVFEPMAEVLLYRLTQRSFELTDRQKRLGKALFRFIADRDTLWLLAAEAVERSVN